MAALPYPLRESLGLLAIRWRAQLAADRAHADRTHDPDSPDWDPESGAADVVASVRAQMLAELLAVLEGEVRP